jgi:hypothetical protein
MALLVNLIFFLAIPAAIAAGVAFGLARLMPAWSMRRRTGIAAFLAGALPMSIPIIAVLASGGHGYTVVALAALVVVGLVIMAVIGLPVALIIGRRNAPSSVDPKAFD